MSSANQGVYGGAADLEIPKAAVHRLAAAGRQAQRSVVIFRDGDQPGCYRRIDPRT
jgi:hypothetical protein